MKGFVTPLRRVKHLAHLAFLVVILRSGTRDRCHQRRDLLHAFDSPKRIIMAHRHLV